MAPTDPFWSPELAKCFQGVQGIRIRKVPFTYDGRRHVGFMVLVPAQSADSPGTALFSHGLAGSVLSHQSLAVARGFHAAGYGLCLVETPFSLNRCGNTLWHWRFRKQQACYDAAVSLAQQMAPGPLILAGTSFGGLYALERGLADGLATIAIAPVLSGRLSLEGRQHLDPQFLRNMRLRGFVDVPSEITDAHGRLSQDAWRDWIRGVDVVSKLKAAAHLPPISVIAGAVDRRVRKERLVPLCASLGIPVKLIPNANHTFDGHTAALSAAAFEAITQI